MQKTQPPPPCPICTGRLLQAIQGDPLGFRLQCANCGEHRITSVALDDMPGLIRTEARRACVAHGVAKLPAGELITSELIGALVRTQSLPPAMERLDNLVLYLAATYAPGQRTTLDATRMCATVGAATAAEAQWVLDEALNIGLLAGDGTHRSGRLNWGVGNVALTVKGWMRHAELMRDGAGSRHAFMAMKFGDDEMQRVFSNFMRPAVSETGFELRTTAGDHQTAGSIDNRMRVELRTSRFVLCDLTHSNQGAYWEAGFAEGLGRPVIYTCRGDVLDTPKAVHFDTAHQLIIRWDVANIDAAMQELKDTIRATLPAEASMEDN